MIKRIFPVARLPLLTLLVVSSAASAAGSTDFCTGDSCKSLTIANEASVIVTKVTINQVAKNECAAVEKARTKNMSKDKFTAMITPTCTYDIVFTTTKGCLGDKKLELTPATMAKRGFVVSLVGSCGSLKVKAGKNRGGTVR